MVIILALVGIGLAGTVVPAPNKIFPPNYADSWSKVLWNGPVYVKYSFGAMSGPRDHPWPRLFLPGAGRDGNEYHHKVTGNTSLGQRQIPGRVTPGILY